jgi:SAM-dependent methyltransferase
MGPIGSALMTEQAEAQQSAALARLYDVDMLDDPGDLDLYLALAARAGGPVLELATGSGRLAIPLAVAGHSVTGVDRDLAMLTRARRVLERHSRSVAGRITWLEADIRGLRLARTDYRLAFIGLNSLLLLSDRAAQRDAVGLLGGALAPGGIAVVDVWLPDPGELARFDGRIGLEYHRTDPETGRLVVKTASAVYESSSGCLDLTAIYEEGAQGEPPVRWLRTDRLRLVSADELRSFAQDAGLGVELLAGGYDMEPMGPGSERAILVATKS